MSLAEAERDDPVVSNDKMTKYIKRIQLMEDFKDIGQSKGGYWEDSGYQWYAWI